MTLDTAEQFFYDNAGFSFDPATQTEDEGRVETAKALAKAERAVQAGHYYFTVEPDDTSWDGDVPYDGPLWVVALWTVETILSTDLVSAVGSVACERDDDYIRVVSAELALDAGL